MVHRELSSCTSIPALIPSAARSLRKAERRQKKRNREPEGEAEIIKDIKLIKLGINKAKGD